MKKFLSSYLRSLLCSGILLLMSASSYASHILGAELRYKWISGYKYEVTVFLYGDCGPSSRSSFSTLPMSAPVVCIYNQDTLKTSVTLPIQDPTAGVNVTPVCPADSNLTQCTDDTYAIPGIKKFVYTNTVTLPYTSKNWRFIYEGDNTGGAAAGRTTSITNLYMPGSTIMQLIDTLNTTTSRGHNSSPELTVEPVPFFCAYTEDCYNPGATDIFDTSAFYDEPSGDSLVFSLVTPTNSSSGGGGCSGTFVLSFCTYVPGLDAWTTPFIQPMGPGTPIQCTTGTSYEFNPATGQLCFDPIGQRSTIVYNIDEYFHDTLTGSIQREMNFYVDTSCTYTDPTGNITSFTGAGDTSAGTHYTACQYSGDFTLVVNPREPDTTLFITVTATGLVTGLTFNVVGNGTNAPVGTITGNTDVMVPGSYTVFLTYEDNNCPLQGQSQVAFTITVLPVPSITYAVVAPPTCNTEAVVSIIPGGTGKPWTMYVSVPPGGITADTLLEHTDTAAFLDSLKPGFYHLTIYTATSNLCNVDTLIQILPHRFKDTLTYINPAYCGSTTGELILQGLDPGTVDSVLYRFNGIAQPHTGFIITADSTDTVTGLLAGVYDSIITIKGLCVDSPALGPYTLVNPPFTLRTLKFTSPSKHCACDGTDTLYGLHPGQLDSLTYSLNGIPQPMLISLIGADSMIYLTGLCAGNYSDFVVRTDSVCADSITTFTDIAAPPFGPNFTPTEHYGCKADTMVFANTSTPATGLTFRWDFGDGTTDTAANPRHPYYGIQGETYSVTLTISNGICDSTDTQSYTLNNYIYAGFSFAPNPYACQDSSVKFNDTTVGVGMGGSSVLSYLWNFGDGNTANTANVAHVFQNTGTYQVMLVAGNNVPCYDTAYATVYVDSISPLYIQATDSVICRGQAVTFTGIYTTIGDTGVVWSFGDNNGIVGVNPVVHSFDATGPLTVTINTKYRACPSASFSRTIQVYPSPELYLGPDTAMCPGTTPILLSDNQNSANTLARWLWSTGETTPGITVMKPGTYVLVVTIDGCSTSDTVFVRNDCYISVPNVFSPNGDGVNDYFFPRQLLSTSLATFKMSIYNRWGQEVYETTGIDGRGWDGKFNNLPQPEGVYVYIIDAGFNDGQVEHHQGNVTLIR